MPEDVVCINTISRSPGMVQITHQDDISETTRRKQQVDPVFNLVDLNVIARRDNAGLV
jgi:hypothetical protein